MGCSPFSNRNCLTNYSPGPAPAPNPEPERWHLLEKAVYAKGYVLCVRYLDCTNFEGVKILVFRGKIKQRRSLDPHFNEDDPTLIARFRPGEEGWGMACTLASNL